MCNGSFCSCPFGTNGPGTGAQGGGRGLENGFLSPRCNSPCPTSSVSYSWGLSTEEALSLSLSELLDCAAGESVDPQDVVFDLMKKYNAGRDRGVHTGLSSMCTDAWPPLCTDCEVPCQICAVLGQKQHHLPPITARKPPPNGPTRENERHIQRPPAGATMCSTNVPKALTCEIW